jgi:hypothetical protein
VDALAGEGFNTTNLWPSWIVVPPCCNNYMLGKDRTGAGCDHEARAGLADPSDIYVKAYWERMALRETLEMAHNVISPRKRWRSTLILQTRQV